MSRAAKTAASAGAGGVIETPLARETALAGADAADTALPGEGVQRVRKPLPAWEPWLSVAA